MTTEPWPKENPNDGDWWVQFNRHNGDSYQHALMYQLAKIASLGTQQAESLSAQLGQELPKRTKSVPWQKSIGELLPDGSEIDAAWRAANGVGFVASGSCAAQISGSDGTVEVLV